MSNSTNSTGELRTAISLIRTKTSELSNSSFLEQISGARVDSARSQIKLAESSVARQQLQVESIASQLETPPTKEVTGRCGKTTTVVDQEAVKKLQAQKSNSEVQLNQARGEVSKAQQDADIASQEVLSQSGITNDLQTEIQGLIVKSDNIKETLTKGDKVDEREIKSLTNGLTETMAKIDNPSAGVRDAFLQPMNEKLNEILRLVQANPQLIKASSGSGENNTSNTDNQEERVSETATTS
jgi:hypothetical protein